MIFKTKNLDFFIINAVSKKHAIDSFIHYRIGVTENDIVEHKEYVPKEANVMEAIHIINNDALIWWNSLCRYSHESVFTKEYYFNEYAKNNHTNAMYFNELKPIEIEQIWNEAKQSITKKENYSYNELVSFLTQFAEIVDELYRPYTRNNVHATYELPSFIKKKIG